MNNSQNQTICLNGQTINYILIRKNVKNINLRVTLTGIYISANKNVSLNYIENFMISNTEFILKNLDRISKLPQPTEKEYKNGEFFSFLGKKLSLKIIQSKKEDVTIDGEHLLLYTNFPDDINKKKLLINKFYSEQCEKVFTDIVNNFYPIFQKMDVKYPVIKIRKMKSKWGSCIPIKKQITINSILIELHKDCIEYVIMHELCHFIQANHSKDFYNLVESLMPDWKTRRDLLNKYII